MIQPSDADIAWARALTNVRMAADLDQLARSVRFHSASQRTALLAEAAHRLRRAPRDETPRR